MNKLIIKNKSLMRSNRDEEEQFEERQALIDEQELNDDEVNLFCANPYGIRHRQSGYKDQTNLSEINEGYELRNINGNLDGYQRTKDLVSEPFVEFAYYDIKPGDSLQSICLRFACSINQIKRYNGLMTDQDFHALKKIKLPIGKLGLLEEFLNSSQQDQTNDRPSVSSRPKMTINSPGSALSISTNRDFKFKPLLSPGFSSDRINMLDKTSNQNSIIPNGDIKTQHNHSHSFSSLREFHSPGVNITIEAQQLNMEPNYLDTKQLTQQNFIKSDLTNHERVEDLLTGDNIDSNLDIVERVFQDLDFHVERAKVAAETYNLRAEELVSSIDINNTDQFRENLRRSRASKIPELFFCKENFGLNYKKLLVFIFVVCLVVPLVYINQSSVVTT